ncbi:MAG: hypothetical protein AAB582_01150 [Patescibacteria group bacterium]
MGLFGKRTAYNVALIDVSSASVRGAYARVEEGKPPIICYTAYLAIDPSVDGSRPGDLPEAQMLACVASLSERLIREGAPVLREMTGSGDVKHVFVSIGAPWQQSEVRVEMIEAENPFLFTKLHLEGAKRKNPIPEGKLESGEAVVATILNGYESRQPFGKKVKRADLVILSSMLDRAIVEAIQKTLRQAYHTHNIHMTAFAPVAYEILRDLYPHQKEFLVFDVAGTATDVVFVKGGLLIDVKTLDAGVHDLLHAARTSGVTGIDAESGNIIDPSRNARFASRVTEVQAAWLESLRTTLSDFSARHPLPRTIFLLADGETRDFLKRLLDSDPLRTLWLSEEPFKIVPVLPAQFTEVVLFRGTASGDAYLAMLALYYSRRIAHFAPVLVQPTPSDLSTQEKPTKD